jgi:flagellar protein FliS
MISTRSDYLYTEVMTATPQRLQLMLVEAALRSADQARQHWAEGRDDSACLALIRSQNILTELLATLNPHADDPLQQRVIAIYMFIYRSLIAANLEHSEDHLESALRVLETERETWQLVCSQLGSHGELEAVGGRTSFEA